MHTHDCIHEHLPRLASQRTPQRYVAPEKAAAAEGGGTAQALRIHVSAESLSSDPGRACFAEGESYSAFEGGDEYTCASADVITAAKRAMLLEQLMPQATTALSRLLRVQRLDGPLVLGKARCGYGGGVPVPEAHRTAGVDADFVVYLTARPIDVGGESTHEARPAVHGRHAHWDPVPRMGCVSRSSPHPGETIAYSGHCEQDQHGRPIAAHFNWSPRHLPAHPNPNPNSNPNPNPSPNPDQVATPPTRPAASRPAGRAPGRGGGAGPRGKGVHGKRVHGLPGARGHARAHARPRLLRTAPRAVRRRRYGEI